MSPPETNIFIQFYITVENLYSVSDYLVLYTFNFNIYVENRNQMKFRIYVMHSKLAMLSNLGRMIYIRGDI